MESEQALILVGGPEDPTPLTPIGAHVSIWEELPTGVLRPLRVGGQIPTFPTLAQATKWLLR